MAIFFFDSSAIVKRYVDEQGSEWVCQLTDARENIVHIVSLTPVEVVAAISRRVRNATVTAEEAASATRDLRTDLSQRYHIVPVSAALIETAMALAEKRGLRGYDAVQLAAAVMLSSATASKGLSLTLISADAELNSAANAEGLITEDPVLHSSSHTN